MVINRNNLIAQTSFCHAQTNMASSGLRKNVMLIKFILTTDGTDVCVRETHGAKREDWPLGEGPYLPEMLM